MSNWYDAFVARRARQACGQLMRNTWNELRVALASGRVKYDEIEGLKTSYTFMRQFHDAYSQTGHVAEITAKSIINMYRAQEVHTSDPARMVPDPRSASLNRFNPKGEAFLYLSTCPGGSVSNHVSNRAITTCLRECRLQVGAQYTTCRFQWAQAAKDSRIVDLVIRQSEAQLIDNLLKARGRGGRRISKDMARRLLASSVGRVPEIARCLLQIYLKMMSEELFLPVPDAADLHFEYAPFHALASYFRACGLSGIRWESTVDPGGYCLALFSRFDAEPVANTLRQGIMAK